MSFTASFFLCEEMTLFLLLGYIGLSKAIVTAQHNEVVKRDVVKEKAELVNNILSPIVDKEITDIDFLSEIRYTISA